MLPKQIYTVTNNDMFAGFTKQNAVNKKAVFKSGSYVFGFRRAYDAMMTRQYLTFDHQIIQRNKGNLHIIQKNENAKRVRKLNELVIGQEETVDVLMYLSINGAKMILVESAHPSIDQTKLILRSSIDLQNFEVELDNDIIVQNLNNIFTLDD